MGAKPNTWMQVYSQYVPNANSPAPNAAPVQPARRGGKPRISANRAAGARTAISHQPNGANATLSEAPVAKAAAKRHRACICNAAEAPRPFTLKEPTRRRRAVGFRLG